MEETVKMGMKRIGLEKKDWKTLVIAASATASLSRDDIWSTWIALEEWPVWSPALHQSAEWVGEPGWKEGAQFTQVLSLGMPLGTVVGHETVIEVIPGTMVAWTADDDSIKACHIWRFEDLGDGSVRVMNVEVFHGSAVGLLKSLVAGNWRKKFRANVDGLIAHAGKTS